MHFYKLRCLECNRDFNAYIFNPNEKGVVPGYSLKEYPCPNCQSVKKAMYKLGVQKIINNNDTERNLKPIKDIIQQKIFHNAKRNL